MKKAALFVAQGVQDEEYLYPYYRLQEAGFDLDVVISHLPERYPNPTGKYGIPIRWNKTTKDLTGMCEHDILIVAGGWQAPEIMRMDSNLLTYLHSANKHDKIIAAICHGPQVLISANVVKNKKITSYIGIKDDVVNAGAYYINEGVVVDDNFITAQHYKDNPRFLKTILKTYNTQHSNSHKQQYPL